MNEKKKKERKIAQNSWYDWYNWLIKYIPSPIKKQQINL